MNEVAVYSAASTGASGETTAGVSATTASGTSAGASVTTGAGDSMTAVTGTSSTGVGAGLLFGAVATSLSFFGPRGPLDLRSC